MKKLIISGLAAVCLTGTTAAHAEAESVRVNFADLDLTRESDVNELNKRVLSAVEEACEPSSYVLIYAIDRACINNAMSEAKTQIQEKRTVALAMANEAGQ